MIGSFSIYISSLWLPLVVFEVSLAPFGMPWSPFGCPLGPPWPSQSFPWVLWAKLWAKFLILSKNGCPIPSKWAVSLQPADKIEPRGTRGTQNTLPTFATFPTQQVLLRAPFLHAPGARMTVVELTPSNHCSLPTRSSLAELARHSYIYLRLLPFRRSKCCSEPPFYTRRGQG